MDSDPEFALNQSQSSVPSWGRLIGIDVGTVRVGLAICDPDRILASPLTTYTRQNRVQDAEFFRKVAIDEKAVGLVVGLPIMLDGSEQSQAAECRAYGTWLNEVTQLPVVYADERFTSSSAEDALRDAKVRGGKRKGKRDRIAAQMILQYYLDSKDL